MMKILDNYRTRKAAKQEVSHAGQFLVVVRYPDYSEQKHFYADTQADVDTLIRALPQGWSLEATPVR